MKKLLLVVILLLCVSLSIATFTIQTFSNGLLSENLTFSGNQNITRNLTLPRNSNIINSNISISGFKINLSSYYENPSSVYSVNWFGANITSACFDGDWSWHGTDSACYGQVIYQTYDYLYINYTKNINKTILNATWTIDFYLPWLEYRYLNLTSSCINAYTDKIVLRIDVYYDGTEFGYSRHASCYDGSSWTILDTYTGNINIRILKEEGLTLYYESQLNNTYLSVNNNILWNYSGIFNTSQNVSLNYSLINNTLQSCNCSGCILSSYNCSIPIIYHSDDSGILNYYNLNVSYNDISSPFWSLNSTNNTNPKQNNDIKFTIKLEDYNQLDYSIFSWNCTNNGWQNLTSLDISGNSVTIQFNETLSYTNFTQCNYKIYANDSSNNWNVTDTWTIYDRITPNTTATAIDNESNSYTFSTWSSLPINISLSCQDDFYSGANTIKYCTNTSGDGCYPNITYSTPVKISAGGSTYFRYFCYDNSGNNETIQSKLVKIGNLGYSKITDTTLL